MVVKVIFNNQTKKLIVENIALNNKPLLQKVECRYYSTKKKPNEKLKSPEIIPFMPVVNIPFTELAQTAFYSLHRPLLGLSIVEPPLINDQKPKEYSEEDILSYMSSLKPFQPPDIPTVQRSSIVDVSVEVDRSYFLNHNNNYDEITDYLTAMQEKLEALCNEDKNLNVLSHTQKGLKSFKKRKGFFEKN